MPRGHYGDHCGLLQKGAESPSSAVTSQQSCVVSFFFFSGLLLLVGNFRGRFEGELVPSICWPGVFSHWYDWAAEERQGKGAVLCNLNAVGARQMC